MKLKKKLKALLVSLTLISFTMPAMASPKGTYQLVKEGQQVGFDGVCFDHQATGAIFAKLKSAEQQCKLLLDYEMKKQKADFDLHFGNLKVRYDTLKTETDKIILIKDEEIRSLQAAALKRPNRYWYLWAIGGFTVGVVGTLGIVWIIK